MPKRKRANTASKSRKRQKTGAIYKGASTRYVARTAGVRAITETKYFDSEKASTAVPVSTTTWASTEMDPTTANALFTPSAGNAYDQREGRKVYVKAMKIRGILNVAAQADQSTVEGAAIVRVVLFIDKQTNGAQANGEDVIGSGTNILPVQMWQNPASFGRFRVLKDKTWIMQNPNVTYDGTNVEQLGIATQFKMTVKFRKPLLVNYNNTNGGTVADIVDNSFHILAVTNSAGLAVTLSYKCRTVFCE